MNKISLYEINKQKRQIIHTDIQYYPKKISYLIDSFLYLTIS